ncbi:MAG: 3-phosphoshikimate 1-carboxyvinyltransferase [Oligoflexus sp.]
MHTDTATWLEIQPITAQKQTSSSTKLSISCGRDKSLTHRAIIFAAMAKGTSTIHAPLLGQDCRSTMSCFRELGVDTKLDGSKLTVSSQGFGAWHNPRQPLDCGNSGTTARLLSGLFAALPDLTVTLIGDESLSKRPMRRVVDPLKALGAKIEGPENAEFLPLTIHGRRLSVDASPQPIIIDKASAQIKSALLLAATQMQGKISVQLPAGARDHTEIMLRRFGGRCVSETEGGIERIHFQGPWQGEAFTCRVPVDPSSAAFFAVLGLLQSQGELRLPEVLANPTRIGFFKVLERMSQNITLQDEADDGRQFLEPTSLISVKADPKLRATTIQADEVPTLVDEIPILAVAAAFAEGRSSFYGLSELRVKESDRLTKTAELLTLAGAKVQIDGDDLHIDGGLQAASGFSYDPVGDHRLAMAAAVLAKRSKTTCRIKNPDCADVSFPGFFEQLARVTA